MLKPETLRGSLYAGRSAEWASSAPSSSSLPRPTTELLPLGQAVLPHRTSRWKWMIPRQMLVLLDVVLDLGGRCLALGQVELVYGDSLPSQYDW